MNTHVDALAVLGCVVNGIPMVAELYPDRFATIQTPDQVAVDAHRGIMVVTDR